MAEDFIKYSEYMGNAAYMHQTAYKPFEDLRSMILNIDKSTIENQVVADNNVEKTLYNQADSAIQQILVSFSQISYLEGSFVALNKYIRKKYGVDTVDEFLTANNIKVSAAFAKVNGVLADPISETNIDG